jgi:hypothetical protein
MRFRLLFLYSLLTFIFTGSLCADILNGGFEISEPNEGVSFLLPVDWECEYYTVVDCNFVPDPSPLSGSSQAWKLDDVNGLEPYEGEFFVMLSTGDPNPAPGSPGDDITFARIKQEVEFLEGQKLSGAYFFGTYDYTPYDDYASIELVPVFNGRRNIILVDIDLNDVGTYSSLEDWETFNHIFTADDAGVYYLTITVSDLSDSSLLSFFAVDALEVCWMPEHGDINFDCEVNLEDFYYLSHDWLLYDPNYISTDPNSWRQYETDFDGSRQVDEADLSLMSEYWLYEQ